MSILGRIDTAAIDAMPEPCYCVDKHRRIVFWNQAARELTGFSPHDVVGFSCSDNILCHVDAEGKSLCMGMCPLARSMTAQRAQEGFMYVHHADGYRFPVTVRVSPVLNDEGEVIGAVEVFSPCRNERSLRDDLQRLDQLGRIHEETGVATQSYLMHCLESSLAASENAGVSLAFVRIELDAYEQLRTRWGLQVAKKMLRAIAKTISSNMRPFDLVGAWEGSGLAAILQNVDAFLLDDLADRMVSICASTFLMLDHEEHRVRVASTISLGATLSEPQDSISSMVERADAALMNARMGGGNCAQT